MLGEQISTEWPIHIRVYCSVQLNPHVSKGKLKQSSPLSYTFNRL